MNRRSFLKTAGFIATLGSRAAARTLVLLNADENAAISRIEWMVYDTGRRGPTSDSEHRCAVRLTTASGLQGWADAPATAAPDPSTTATIRDVLQSYNVTQRDAAWRQLYQQGLSLDVLGAIDIALWDLQGRLEDKPVHALLGTRRQKVKASARTGFNLGSPAQYAEYALACKERSLHGCKVQPYLEQRASDPQLWIGGSPVPITIRNPQTVRGFPDRDMSVYRAVRDAVGADYACMADNHCTYTFDEALRVGRLLDDLRYEWYESPMPETDDWRDRYKALTEEVRTPVCAPQTHPDSYPSRLGWVTGKACDIATIDARHGGLTACLELALACEAAGIPLELRDAGPDSYPHLQLLAATSEVLIRYLELPSYSPEARVLPGRATPEPAVDNQGYVALPQAPGMGLDLDWTFIRTHAA
jgi:L-alanine-DL-glutamate epimerase-like enolase superfamily enzyme